jgi:ABC-2 type transport system ATP-binding protein
VAPGTLFGLLAPTAGDVRVAGQTVSLENVELRRVIGILPEDAALFHSLTIWEHLELSRPLYGLSREDTRARAIQLLRHLDLERDRSTLGRQRGFDDVSLSLAPSVRCYAASAAAPTSPA